MGNNQRDLSEANMTDPGESSFAKAMRLAQNRTLSLVDHECIILIRVWCILELFFTLMGYRSSSSDSESQEGLWALYTSYEHKDDCETKYAVGIVEGGATCDRGYSEYAASRESHFPLSRLTRAININIETA